MLWEKCVRPGRVPIDRIWVSFQLWGPWVCGVFRDFCGRKSLFAWYVALSTLLYPHHWRLHVLYRNIVWAWEQHRGKSPAAHHQGQLRAGASSTGCIVFAGHSLWSWCYRPNPAWGLDQVGHCVSKWKNSSSLWTRPPISGKALLRLHPVSYPTCTASLKVREDFS